MTKVKQRKIFPVPELYSEMKERMTLRVKENKNQLKFDFDETVITRPWECQPRK